MTVEEIDILIRDLCGRLAASTMICINGEDQLLDSVIYDDGWYVNFVGDNKEGYSPFYNDVKPYLFPLSSMTEEQKVEFDKVAELDIEYTITQIKNDSPIWTSGLNRFNWLIKNHFDVYGLIPMGLALDATNLNIY